MLLASSLVGCLGTGGEDVGLATEPEDDANEPITLHHTLVVPYYVNAAGVDTQNMEDANWEVEVPADATQVRALARWDPSTPFAQDQGLMLHEGRQEDAGEMFGEPGVGSSPIQTPWTTIPDGLETVTIMCHVHTSPPYQPVGIEHEQETDIVVQFR